MTRRVLKMWDAPQVWEELYARRAAVAERLETLERAWGERRRINHERQLRYVQQFGPGGPGPRMLDKPAREIKARLEWMAQLEVLNYCLHHHGDPLRLRAGLKRCRDVVDDAFLYESELAAFLRAKNRMVGKMQVWLDGYLGPDPAPFAEWGRSPLAPRKGDDAFEEEDECDPFGQIAAGAPPPDPEFAPDALAKLFEGWMVQHPRRWLVPLLVDWPRRPPANPDAPGPPRSYLDLAYEHAVRAFAARAASAHGFKDLVIFARACARQPAGPKELLEDFLYLACWKIACRAIAQALRAPVVKAYLSGDMPLPPSGARLDNSDAHTALLSR